MGQNFDNESTFWKWVTILKIEQHFRQNFVIVENFGNRARFWKSDKILEIVQNFGNGAKFWKSGKILKILKIEQDIENRTKFWKCGKILKIVQNFEHQFENGAKFWKLGKILKMGQFWKSQTKFSPKDVRVIYTWSARAILSQIFRDVRASSARWYARFTYTQGHIFFFGWYLTYKGICSLWLCLPSAHQARIMEKRSLWNISNFFLDVQINAISESDRSPGRLRL